LTRPTKAADGSDRLETAIVVADQRGHELMTVNLIAALPPRLRSSLADRASTYS